MIGKPFGDSEASGVKDIQPNGQSMSGFWVFVY